MSISDCKLRERYDMVVNTQHYVFEVVSGKDYKQSKETTDLVADGKCVTVIRFNV